MEGPNRRMHARYTCRLGFSSANTGGETYTGEVLNIGMGGAYLRVIGTLKVRKLTLRIAVGSELLSLDATVVRSAGVDPTMKNVTLYGVEFGKDTATQGRLRLVLDQVRTRTNLGGPKTMSGYWNR